MSNLGRCEHGEDYPPRHPVLAGCLEDWWRPAPAPQDKVAKHKRIVSASEIRRGRRWVLPHHV